MGEVVQSPRCVSHVGFFARWWWSYYVMTTYYYTPPPPGGATMMSHLCAGRRRAAWLLLSLPSAVIFALPFAIVAAPLRYITPLLNRELFHLIFIGAWLLACSDLMIYFFI